MKNIIYLVSLFILIPQIGLAVIFLEDKKGYNATRAYVPQFDRAERMKMQKKLGIGVAVAGVSGIVGAHAELNLRPELSVMGGAGLSKDFNSISFQIKRSFWGKDIIPYAALGYNHWFSNDNKPVYESVPNFLSTQFLSESERASGEFSESIINLSLGLQFYQLGGQWTGLSLYAEVIGLLDLDDIEFAPTVSLGSTYYF